LPAGALGPFPLIGYAPDDSAGACWTFPEVDAAGRVVGILRRYVTPRSDGKSKLRAKGGRAGLTVPDGWRERAGPVFVVEGPTDALAMTAAGLSCVGRPSNSACAAGGVVARLAP
jgi:hypothetical protein